MKLPSPQEINESFLKEIDEIKEMKMGEYDFSMQVADKAKKFYISIIDKIEQKFLLSKEGQRAIKQFNYVIEKYYEEDTKLDKVKQERKFNKAKIDCAFALDDLRKEVQKFNPN